MEDVRKENEHRWEVLFQAWEIADNESRLAQRKLRDAMVRAQQDQGSWPTASDLDRVDQLVARADDQRKRADEFVRMLLS